MARIPQRTHTALPRIWLPTSVDVQLGATLAPGGGAEEVAALAPVRDAGLPQRIASVRVDKGQYTYVLRGGFELRVGAPENLAAEARRSRGGSSPRRPSSATSTSASSSVPWPGSTLKSQVEVEVRATNDVDK